MTAPGFCMLLRKHLQNARIVDITQPGLERILHLELEHLNELGHLCRKLFYNKICTHRQCAYTTQERQVHDYDKEYDRFRQM